MRPSATVCADDTCRTVFGSRRLCAASGTFAIVAVTAGPTLRQPACAANAMPIMAQSGRLSFTSPLKAAHQNQYERAAKTTRVLIGQGSVDRKSVVSGKRVSGRVDLSGRRSSKKKNKTK